MAHLRNNKGSTIAEACFVLAAWSLLLGTSLGAAGWAHLRVWSHQILYEALICVAEKQSDQSCEAKALTQTRLFLPFLSGAKVQIARSWGLKNWQANLSGIVLQETNFQQHLELTPPSRVIR